MPVQWNEDALRTIRGEPREVSTATPPEPMKLKYLPPSYTLAVWSNSLGTAAVAHDLPSWTADGKLFAVLRIPDNT
jgi:hypothetical protein